MSKGSNTVSTTQQGNPWAMQQYYDLLGRANTVAGTPYEGYGGEEVAPINQQQQLGIGNINANANYANSYIQGGAGMVDAAGNPITSEDINRYQDPYTNSVIAATEAQFGEDNARAQSQVTGNAAAQGALGGNRVGVAQALTEEGQARAQAPVIAGLRSQGFQSALGAAQADKNRQLQSGNAYANIGVAGQQAALTGAGAQVGAGTLQQQTQQQLDTQNRADYYQKMGYPFQVAQWLAGISTGVGSQMGGTSTTTGPQPNQWANAAGLGLAGLGMFAADGGGVDGFAEGGAPDMGPLSASGWVPSINLTPGKGAPDAPKLPGEQKGLDTKQLGAAAKGLKGLGSSIYGGLAGTDLGMGDLSSVGVADMGPGSEAMLAGMFADGGGVPGFAWGGAPWGNMGQQRRLPPWLQGGVPSWLQRPSMGSGQPPAGMPFGMNSPGAPAPPVMPQLGSMGGNNLGLAPPAMPSGDFQSTLATQGANPLGGGMAPPSMPVIQPIGGMGPMSQPQTLPPGLAPQTLDPSANNGYGQRGPVMARGGVVRRRGYATAGGVPVSVGLAGGSFDDRWDAPEEPDLSDPEIVKNRNLLRNTIGYERAGNPTEPDDVVKDQGSVVERANKIYDGIIKPSEKFPERALAYGAIPGVGADRPAPSGDVDTTEPARLGVGRDIVVAPRRGIVAPPGSAAPSDAGRSGGLLNLSDEAKQGLISMGLAMASNRVGGPGSFVNAVGEGGQSGMATYADARGKTAAAAALARKEAFEREKFDRPYREMTAEQKAKLALETITPIPGVTTAEGHPIGHDKRHPNAPPINMVTRQPLTAEEVTGLQTEAWKPYGSFVSLETNNPIERSAKTGQMRDAITKAPLGPDAKVGNGRDVHVGEDDIKMRAAQLALGDEKSAYGGLGAGAFAGQAKQRVNTAAREMLMRTRGMTAEDAGKHLSEQSVQFAAGRTGAGAEARTAGTRLANLGIIIEVADAAIPAALKTSEEVYRSGFKPFNMVMEKGQWMFSDPKMTRFGMANLQVAEAWARAMNPTGVMRESDRDMALHFLNTQNGPDAYKAGLAQLKKQIDAEREGVRKFQNRHGNNAEPGETEEQKTAKSEIEKQSKAALEKLVREHGGTSASSPETKTFQGKTYRLKPGADRKKQESWEVVNP